MNAFDQSIRSSLLLRRDECSADNEYNGDIGVRVSAIFVILVGGAFGALFPIVASRNLSKIRIPDILFFAAKYFGSGVIVATSLIHLLQPANESLSDPCLGPEWQVYPYAFGICLFVIFLTFFVELVSQRYLAQSGIKHSHGPSGLNTSGINHNHTDIENCTADDDDHHSHGIESNTTKATQVEAKSFADAASNIAIDVSSTSSVTSNPQNHDGHHLQSHKQDQAIASQLGAIFFLEFGIIFHSVFVGLTLAVAGPEFKTLYIVLVFHQLFEGLGLGTRLAAAPWPQEKKWMPWAMGVAFGLTTPIAIAIGLGVRKSYPPGSRTALITNGIFDSVSSGILLYTGLVELIASEFLHSPEFHSASTSRVMSAFGFMCLGAGLMALLGRWA